MRRSLVEGLVKLSLNWRGKQNDRKVLRMDLGMFGFLFLVHLEKEIKKLARRVVASNEPLYYLHFISQPFAFSMPRRPSGINKGLFRLQNPVEVHQEAIPAPNPDQPDRP